VAQDPEVIKREIQETREHMGDTVDALAYKADVPTRTKDRISDTMQTVKGKVSGAGGSVSERSPSTGDVKQGAKKAVGMAEANPIGLAVGALAVGFLAGTLAPRTRVEDEKLGPMADQVKEQAMETGQEALERGKQVAQEAASTAKDEAQAQGREVAQSAKENAQSISTS
jgi:gas vesicle protein